MRVLLWGTFDPEVPRNRVLRLGLERNGCAPRVVARPVWRGLPRSAAGPRWRAALRLVAGYVLAWPGLILRFLRGPRPDVVLIGYLGLFDALVLAPIARLRGVPVVWDVFISLYDTVVQDRGLAAPASLPARGLYGLEWLALRIPNRVCIDTEAHANYLRARFGLASERVFPVPVGADDAFFRAGRSPARAAAPAPDDAAPLRVLFYGTLIPLHGLPTILGAARRVAPGSVRFRLIGTGQERPILERFLAEQPAAPVEWIPWIPFEDLVEEIRAADVCLGIFGDTDKAARVVPNKVYQVLAAGRTLVTRDSPAMRELIDDPGHGIHLVAPADPDALARCLECLGADATLRQDHAAITALRERITAEAVARVLLEGLEETCR